MTTLFTIDTIDSAYDLINSSYVETQQYIWDESSLKRDEISSMDIIQRIETELSPIHAFVRLAINYFYQVNNGRHLQYFSNGYHSSMQSGFAGNISPEDDLLQKLKELALKVKPYLNADPYLEKLIEIINSIDLEIDDEEKSTEEDCYYCNGSGEKDVPNPDFDPDDEDCEEDECISETCDDCDGSGVCIIADNENLGGLTYDCELRCDHADSELYSSNIDDHIMVAIANYQLTL